MRKDKRSKSKYLLLENTMNSLVQDNGYMQYSVVLKTIPRREVVSVRKKISTREEEGMLWIELNEEINK